MGVNKNNEFLESSLLTILSKLQEELPPGGLHLVAAAGDDPLVVPALGVEGALLQRDQLQREPGTQLQQLGALAFFCELVSATFPNLSSE